MERERKQIIAMSLLALAATKAITLICHGNSPKAAISDFRSRYCQYEGLYRRGPEYDVLKQLGEIGNANDSMIAIEVLAGIAQNILLLID